MPKCKCIPMTWTTLPYIILMSWHVYTLVCAYVLSPLNMHGLSAYTTHMNAAIHCTHYLYERCNAHTLRIRWPHTLRIRWPHTHIKPTQHSAVSVRSERERIVHTSNSDRQELRVGGSPQFASIYIYR